MKGGICSKCESEEVYVSDFGNHGIVLPIHTLAAHTINLYVCADCGYLEFYARTGHDLSKVKVVFESFLSGGRERRDMIYRKLKRNSGR